MKFLKFLNTPLSTTAFIVSCVGILVVGGIYLSVMYQLLNPIINSTLWALTGPITKAPSSFNLELNSPEDEMVTFERSIIVSGKTTPKSVVIIVNGNNYQTVEANNIGDFYKGIDLSVGLNNIQISAFDEEGNTKLIERKVFYSEEKL